jgi:hypothetical protein
METTMPEGESAKLTMTLDSPKPLTLALRRPSWAGEGFRVHVNGQPIGDVPPAGSYVELSRVWQTGDRVELVLPKRLRLEPLADNPQRVAVAWGPLVLAGDVQPQGEQGTTRSNRARHETARVPVFVAAGRPVEQWLKPVAGQPGSFRTDGVGRDRDVDFLPFYRLHRRAYAVYWDLFTPEGWQRKSAEYAAEAERQRRLEAATVAYAQLGEMQPERDFNFQGEDTELVRLLNRPGRYGSKWFSLDMPVDANRPMMLMVTYHSDERKPRRFEILVTGRRIAEQTIDRSEPPRFFDIEYAIPAELTRDKPQVTVRFLAAPEQQIGAVYGVRMIRADAPR